MSYASDRMASEGNIEKERDSRLSYLRSKAKKMKRSKAEK